MARQPLPSRPSDHGQVRGLAQWLEQKRIQDLVSCHGPGRVHLRSIDRRSIAERLVIMNIQNILIFVLGVLIIVAWIEIVWLQSLIKTSRNRLRTIEIMETDPEADLAKVDQLWVELRRREGEYRG